MLWTYGFKVVLCKFFFKADLKLEYSGPHFQDSSLSCTPSHGDMRNERNEETKISHPRFQG